MKVIVLNDSNGHTNAWAVNKENLAALLRHLIEAGMCDEDEVGEGLLAEDADAARLEEFILSEYQVNSRGGQCHILEVSETYEEHLNPFT